MDISVHYYRLTKRTLEPLFVRDFLLKLIEAQLVRTYLVYSW